MDSRRTGSLSQRAIMGFSDSWLLHFYKRTIFNYQTDIKIFLGTPDYLMARYFLWIYPNMVSYHNYYAYYMYLFYPYVAKTNQPGMNIGHHNP